MSHRAEIEWLAIDTWTKVGCIRIGGPDYTHECYDDFCRAATVVLNEQSGVAEIKGWDKPHHGHWLLNALALLLEWLGLMSEEGITPSQWDAMGECLLREGIRRYCFSRARGPWRRKHLYWHRRKWDEKHNKWIKDTDE